MPSPFIGADDAARLAYSRAHDNGAAHAVALNIAVSVWFSRCPCVDGKFVRRRVSGLLAGIEERPGS